MILTKKKEDREKKVRQNLINEKLKEGGPFDFNGQNCADNGDNCSGWDGESKRCECGNRRVDWELSDDETYIYAEAY